MTDQIILNADVRERTGSNKARVIRKIDGMVPAIVYGDEKETINIKLKLNELTKASENELFYTQVLLIKTGDDVFKVGKLKSYPTKAFAEKVLNQYGYVVKSSLTKDCTHLINESGIESAKTQTARDRGVIIITNVKQLEE